MFCSVGVSGVRRKGSQVPCNRPTCWFQSFFPGLCNNLQCTGRYSIFKQAEIAVRVVQFERTCRQRPMARGTLLQEASSEKHINPHTCCPHVRSCFFGRVYHSVCLFRVNEIP